MTNELAYFFEHHTPLRDSFYNEVKTALGAKQPEGAFDRLYRDYRYFLMRFMDSGFAEIEKTCSEATKKHLELLKSDAVLLYFQPCYELLLLRDFLINYMKSSHVGGKGDLQMYAAGYFDVIAACRQRFLSSYGALYNVAYETLAGDLKARQAKYEKLLSANVNRIEFRENLTHLLISDLMKGFLKTEDKATGTIVAGQAIPAVSMGTSEVFLQMRSFHMRLYYHKIPAMLEQLKAEDAAVEKGGA